MILEVAALSFDYQENPLLNNVNFILNKGQLLHLRGGNGVGKTTLLKLLAGLLYPNQGEIYFSGQSIHQDLAFYQQNLCYVGHKLGLSRWLTIRENCCFSLIKMKNSTLNKQILDDYLQHFGLLAIADKLCAQLSAGQLRRANLVRLAMTEAKLWLLDEPLTALDAEITAALTVMVQNHLQKGGAVVLTSHQTLPWADTSIREYCL